MEDSSADVSIKIDNDVLVSVSADADITDVNVSKFSITESEVKDVSSTYNGGVTALGDSTSVDRDVANTGDSVDILSVGLLDTDEESIPFSIFTEGLADTAMTGLVLITDVLMTTAFSDATTLL